MSLQQPFQQANFRPGKCQWSALWAELRPVTNVNKSNKPQHRISRMALVPHMQKVVKLGISVGSGLSLFLWGTKSESMNNGPDFYWGHNIIKKIILMTWKCKELSVVVLERLNLEHWQNILEYLRCIRRFRNGQKSNTGGIKGWLIDLQKSCGLKYGRLPRIRTWELKIIDVENPVMLMSDECKIEFKCPCKPEKETGTDAIISLCDTRKRGWGNVR